MRIVSSADCYAYLAELKWGNGFKCRRCEVIRFIKDKQPFTAGAPNSALMSPTTAFTLFHKLKLDIDKGFGMLYEIVTSKKRASSIWLTERFGVQQNTALLFRQKV